MYIILFSISLTSILKKYNQNYLQQIMKQSIYKHKEENKINESQYW